MDSTQATPVVSSKVTDMRAPLVNKKIEHVHKLERKQSSGDLHSRLKTRKLLGVGETDDGDVHRSKLSQILGHSEQLYLKLPRGLRLWQFTTAFMFSCMAAMAIIWPRSLYHYALNEEAQDAAILPTRLYGSALLTLSVMFWNTLKAQDREVIRNSLLASAIYFCLQFFVTTFTLLQQGSFLANAVRVLSHRVIFGAISVYFYSVLGEKGNSKVRAHCKSPGTQEPEADDHSSAIQAESVTHTKTE